MSHVVTFQNHSPIRIASKDAVATVWDAGWAFGHHCIDSYTTKRGKVLYWSSMHHGTDKSSTRRTYFPNVAAIREHFFDSMERYHAEVEAVVDQESILDVDAL